MVTSLIPIQIGQAPPDGAGGQSGRRGGETLFATLIGLGADGPPDPVPAAESKDASTAPWVFPWLSPVSPLPDHQAGPATPAAEPGGGGAAVLETVLRAPGPDVSLPADPTRPIAAIPAEGAKPIEPLLGPRATGPMPLTAGAPMAAVPTMAEAPPAGLLSAVRPQSALPAEAAPIPAPTARLAAGLKPVADPTMPPPALPEGRAAKPAAAAAKAGPTVAAALVHPTIAVLRRLSVATEEGAASSVEPVSSTFRPAVADPARPAQTAETPARPAHPAVQVALSIAKAAPGVPGRLVVELVPHELGRVEIVLDAERRGGRARITADRRETLDLLVTEARVLEKALSDAGVDLGRRGIEFSLRGDGGRDREPPSPQRPAGPPEEPAARPRPEAASSPAPGIALPARGLDILV